ncbi:MAG: FtsX-like permease family protein [Desulfobacteraceae bacterium]|nr:FtsX-like permease family protein [Desulfobacteraceae bacterium]
MDRQVVLPFLKSLEIAYKNLRVRFFRSMITTMSLVLAIAFLTFVGVTTDIINGMLDSGNTEAHQKLTQSGYDIDSVQSRMESDVKQRWIIMLSLLVCVVGIVNAQLMAVTERFREIGTMKCLGALDRFILRLFLLEAGIQGLAGAAIGAVAGCFFALLNAFFRFGTLFLTGFYWSDMAAAAGVAMGVGSLLSLIGVFYPAMVASRMQPVEAMRIEH